MVRKLLLLGCITASIGSGLLTTGCGKSDDGLSKEQETKSDRLDQIAKQSGGDWAKISQSDRDYLVQELGHGDEKSARMILMTKTGGFKGPKPTPGVPPAASPTK